MNNDYVMIGTNLILSLLMFVSISGINKTSMKYFLFVIPFIINATDQELAFQWILIIVYSSIIFFNYHQIKHGFKSYNQVTDDKSKLKNKVVKYGATATVFFAFSPLLLCPYLVYSTFKIIKLAKEYQIVGYKDALINYNVVFLIATIIALFFDIKFYFLWISYFTLPATFFDKCNTKE